MNRALFLSRARAPFGALVAMLVAAPFAFAQAPATTPTALPTTPVKQPALHVAELEHDAGAIARGESVAVEFVLENRGEGELVIKNVQPSCGCTVASFDRRIAPGGSGKVRATLDTRDFSGPITKSLTVLSNDPSVPQLTLRIKAEVRAHVLVAPAFARFVHTQTLPPPTTAVTVWSSDRTDFKVLAASSPLAYVQVTVREAAADERLEAAPGPQWRVELALASDAPVGPLRDFVTVRTNHPEQSELQVPLSGVVRPVLHLTPAKADFGELSLAGQSRKVVLTLINFGAEPVEVHTVATDVRGAEARLVEVEKGKRWKIEIDLTPAMDRGKVDGLLKIETSSPVQPRLEVPFSGRIS